MRASLRCSVLLLLVSACGGGSGGGGTTPSTPVASVTVAPATETVVPFGAVQLTATLKDGSGNELSGRRVDWSSSNAAVANVSSSGLVTGVTVGTVTITATAESKSGSAGITVKDGRAVGTSGATVTGLNGAVTLVIPAGALAQLTNISIEAAQGLPAAPRLVTGTAVEIGPTGTNFAQAATLTIRYTAGNLPAGSHPDSLTLDTYANGVWAPVAGSTVDTAAKEVRAPLSHLSTYGALTPAPLASVEVDSRKLRAPITSVELCVNHWYALITSGLDDTGSPVDARVTAATSNAAIATVTQLSRDSTQFFLRGVSPGTATITFTSGALSQPVTATVTACPKPAILTTSSKDGNFELYRYQNPGFTNLTNNPAADELGRVSPDGSKIGFQSDRAAVGGDLKLYLMDPTGANVRPLLSSQGYQRDLAWAPDGSWLAGVGPKSNGNPGIYRVNPDGTGATLLTPNLSTEEGFPAISPGGRYIAFQQRDRSGATPGPFHIMVMNADGTGARELLPPYLLDPGGADDVTPSFSPLKPGNPEIVFARIFPDGGTWIMRVRYFGGNVLVLTGGGYNYLPSFCQDGEHILYTHSSARGVGPFLILVQDAWLKGSDAPVYIVPGLQQYGQASYFPQPVNPALVYGCKP